MFFTSLLSYSPLQSLCMDEGIMLLLFKLIQSLLIYIDLSCESKEYYLCSQTIQHDKALVWIVHIL